MFVSWLHETLGCRPETVSERLHAASESRIDGLGSKPCAGRKARLTQLERSTILALAPVPPPSKPTYELTGELTTPNPQAELEWALGTLTAAAHGRGIQVARSQVRRIFRWEGIPWRGTRLPVTSTGPDFTPHSPRKAYQLASPTSGPIRDWPAAHPRIQHVYIPVGAAWLNLIEVR